MSVDDVIDRDDPGSVGGKNGRRRAPQMRAVFSVTAFFAETLMRLCVTAQPANKI